MAQAFDAARMAENVAAIRQRMAAAAASAGRDPGDIALCAVCKTRSGETIRQSAALPVDLFGENHMQELLSHYDAGDYLGKPVHFIGHLQTNKVKKVVGRAAVIESVDSLRLMEAIEKEAAKQSLRQDILLEINIGAVESKTGASAEELFPLLEAAQAMEHIPPAFDNGDESRRWFALLRAMLTQAQDRHFTGAQLDTLSMGMTDSFEAAILEGATVVRVGTGIYGARDYPAKP